MYSKYNKKSSKFIFRTFCINLVIHDKNKKFTYLLALLYNKVEMKFDKSFEITHAGEVLIWLIVILVLVACSSLEVMFKDKNDENDYQIFLQDVDGLIVGSPIRMMGVEVGHVTKIKPTNDEVYVEFIINKENIYIPQGSNITVEFSGMAGSKSLEIYLPKDGSYVDKDTAIITVNPPKRLHDSLELLNDMFKKLGSIIYTTSEFGSKIKEQNFDTNIIKKPPHNIDEFINYTNTFLDESNKKASDIRNSLEELKNNAK